MDPYVEGVIRLAERRGLLRGDISVVQEWMLNTLMLIEAYEAREDAKTARVDSLRQAMVIVNPEGRAWSALVRSIYPDIFGREEDSRPETITSTVTEDDLVDSAGTWEFAEQPREDIEDVLKSLGQTMSVTPDEAFGAPEEEEPVWH